MKKVFAVIIALISAWVLFLPFDLPPIPFFFIDEAIALVLLTKSLRYLGIDIARFLPFINSHKRSAKPPEPRQKSVNPAHPGPTIDV
jgi:hypothetical protein